MNIQDANLFDIPDVPLEQDEFFETLASGAGARVERIISHGHTTPEGEWYDQEDDEWVVLLQGEATLTWENGGETDLEPGDWLLIPAHERHRVSSTTTDPPCVWLAVHAPLGSDGKGE